MKKFLPTSKKGFTLIELMVVVVIIVILSVIGISIYAGAQRNARDSIRRTEIKSLGNSIESTKDPTTVNYKYSSTNFGNDYPQNKPRDPLKSATNQQYCLGTGPSAVADPATWAVDSTCPTLPATTWFVAVDDTGAWATSTSTTALAAGVRYWKLCARLETPGTFYCVQNSQ